MTSRLRTRIPSMPRLEESVGSHTLRVILFGTIPTSIPVVPIEVSIVYDDLLVAPKVGAVFVISPTKVLDLVDYSSFFDSDPSEDSLLQAPELLLVSPFLCSDDSKANSESKPGASRPSLPSGSSSHDTFAPSFEFPLAPVVSPPEIRRRLVILIQPGEAIPFSRPYRTHPNGPRPVWRCDILVSIAKVLVNQVMAAPVILILLDSFEESVGSHTSRVILFGTIPTSIHVVPVEVPIVHADLLVTPKVRKVFVISPTKVLDLVDYSSSSDSDPLEDFLPLVPKLLLVSPFLCSNDLKVDSESKPAKQRHERHESLSAHDAMVSRWRDRAHLVCPYSQDHYLMILLHHHLSFLLLLLFPHPRFVDGQRFLSDKGRLFLLVDPTVPILVGQVNSTSDSSSSGSSSGSSLDTFSGSPSNSSSVHSSGCDALESSLDSSYKRSLDLFSPSARPSCKRCRSSTTLVPSSTPVSRSITPTPTDHRFGIDDGVRAPTEDGIGVGVEIAASDIREDEDEFEAEANTIGIKETVVDPLVTGGISESTRGDVPDLEDTFYDIIHYMSEVPLDRITEFKIAQRQLEAVQLIASGERAILAYRIRRLVRENLRVQALLCIERDRVDSLPLEAREANRNIRLGNGNDEGGNCNDDGNENGGGMAMEITMRMMKVLGMLFENVHTRTS
uniref:Uncharacterized protein n=1 Tax=Tanacetum cinerariifolium TaxID=118510 RepID=A0A6L2KBG4_TANCI|nr:hypothetical protein [Tanacetum cinerariifolium]